MKSFFWTIIFLFLSMFFIMLAITYIEVNLKIVNDKDDLWKETLYYGANKAYFRTMNATNIDDNMTLENLYNFSGDDDTVKDYAQVEEELKKDISYFLDSTNTNYKIAAIKAEEDEPCLFYIYFSRKARSEDVYNTVKVGLCPREV